MILVCRINAALSSVRALALVAMALSISPLSALARPIASNYDSATQIQLISLNESACFGGCSPSFLTIAWDDVAHYRGTLPDGRSGSFTALVDFQEITKWLDTQQLPRSSRTYNPGAVDSQRETFVVARGGSRLVLSDYLADDEPPLLFGLHAVLDRAISEASWWPDGSASKFLGYYVSRASRAGVSFYVEEHRILADIFTPGSSGALVTMVRPSFRGATASLSKDGHNISVMLYDPMHARVTIDGVVYAMRRVDYSMYEDNPSYR